MKKAISLMLALVLAISMLGFPALADDVALESAALNQSAELQTAPDQAVPAPKDEINKIALVKDEVAFYQLDGSKIPEAGFPMTKGNKLIVRVAIAGGGDKTVTNGRVSIGTDIKKPKKDLAKVTNEKTKLKGNTEFSFSIKALKELKPGKEYKVFLQTSKTKKYPALARVQIGTIKVVSAKDAEKEEPAET